MKKIKRISCICILLALISFVIFIAYYVIDNKQARLMDKIDIGKQELEQSDIDYVNDNFIYTYDGYINRKYKLTVTVKSKLCIDKVVNLNTNEVYKDAYTSSDSNLEMKFTVYLQKNENLNLRIYLANMDYIDKLIKYEDLNIQEYNLKFGDFVDYKVNDWTQEEIDSLGESYGGEDASKITKCTIWRI